MLTKNFFIESFNEELNNINNVISDSKPKIGKQGIKGPLGDVGDTGSPGKQGPNSNLIGPKGHKGKKGDSGNTITGPPGKRGIKGPPGDVEFPEGITLTDKKFIIDTYQFCIDGKCLNEDDVKKIKNVDLKKCPTYYNIYNKDNCIFTNHPSKNGGSVKSIKCDNFNSNQKWIYNKTDNMIHNKYNKCLDTPFRNKPNTKVHMWSCNSKNLNQKWKYNHESSQIKNNNDYCLESKLNNDIIINTCNLDNERQKWNLI